MGKKALWIGGAAVALLIYNAWVTVPVGQATASDGDLTTVAYRRWLIDPTTIVFDVWSAGSEARMVDMDRRLFKAAEALKDRSYTGVVLAYRGRGRFILDGAHFKEIGETLSYQNPVYVVRTLTEHVYGMDGRPAFGSWSGGLLGVLGKQLEDHNEMHERWYVRSALGLD